MYVTSFAGTDVPIIHQSLVSLNLSSDNHYLSLKPSLTRPRRYTKQLTLYSEMEPSEESPDKELIDVVFA